MRICFAMAVGGALALGADPAGATPVPEAAVKPAPRMAMTVKADPRTGRLVRRVTAVGQTPESTRIGGFVVTPKVVRENAVSPGATSDPAKEIGTMIEETAARHHVDPLLVHSVIKVESNYNTYAISNKGAEGLMQLIPSTAKRFGAKNSFDPQQNIEAGVKYLRHLQGLYKDDRLALAAYNAGEGAVAKYGWIPPYAETQNYVYQVGKKYGEARRAYERKKAEEPAKTDVAKTDAPKPEHPKLESYTDEQGRVFLRTR